MKTTKVLLAQISIIIVLMLASPLYAADIVWEGDESSNWSTPGNWQGGVAPGSGDKAVFDGAVSTNSCSIASNVNVKGIEIQSDYSGTVAQGSGSIVKVGLDDFSQAGGVFSGGNSNIDINGGFTLSNGTFTSTSGLMNIGVDVAVSSSGVTFNHNSGTVELDWVHKTVDFGGVSLNDLQFDNGTYSMTIVSDIIVTGDFRTISNRGVGGISGAGDIRVAGDIHTTSDYFKSTNGGPVLVLDGAGDQYVTADADGRNLPGIEIDKPGGTAYFQANLDLRAGGWKHTQGDVDWGTNSLTLITGMNTQIDAGPTEFNDVIFNAGTYPHAVVGTMNVGGDLTIELIGSISGGTIAVKGNVTSNDTVVAGTAGITLNGTGEQLVNCGVNDLPNGTFTVNKTSGTATLIDDLNLLAHSCNTSQDMIVADGTFDIAGFDLAVCGFLQIDPDAVVTGSGTGMAGILDNSGRVVAEGGGSGNILDLSACGSVENTAGNITTNGWFANDMGKLALPSIPITSENNVYYWGEKGNGTDYDDIDLVNSIGLKFAGDDVGSSLDISLLALDHSGIPDIGDGTLIGAWDFDPSEDLAFDSVDLVFRYDDKLASDLGLNENDLFIYHYMADDWYYYVNSSINPASNLIYSNGITSFSPFVVGLDIDDAIPIHIPEPASLLIFGIAVTGMAVKRFKR